MTQVSDTDLSIIIPIYQVSEELLLRCLKSVQEIRELTKEVILVADGRDQVVCSSPAIQAFAGEAEFKISFYEKEHEGVSAARNFGMDHAGGTWIFFMDADDYISGEAFREVCPLLKKGELDLAVMDYSMIQGQECNRHRYKKEMEAINPVQFQKDLLKPQSGAGFVWAKLYRREWLQETGVCFDTELSAAEDAEFMLKVALKNPRILNVPYNSYYYCYNSESAVHSFRKDYASRYIAGMKKIRADLENENVMARLQDEYDSCVLYHLLLIAVNYSFHPENPVTGKKRIEDFRRLIGQEMFRDSLKNVHPENFSMTRKITLICIQLHLYRMVELIAGVRHRQRRK